MPVPLQLPMLQKSHIHLQDPHQGRLGPSHQEGTVLWYRQHLRAEKGCDAMFIQCLSLDQPWGRSQYLPSLADRKAMPHISRAQCKVQW